MMEFVIWKILSNISTCLWTLFMFCCNLCTFRCVVSTNILTCYIVFFPLCCSLCCGHAARAYSTSFTETAFLSTAKSLLFLPSLSVASTQGHHVCRRDMQWFVAVSWSILWFLMQLSTASDQGAAVIPQAWQLCRGYDDSRKMRRLAFFCHCVRHPSSRSLSSQATLLCYSLH